MACPEEQTLYTFLYGDLAREARAALEVHLDVCSSCRQLIALLARSERTPGRGGLISSHPSPATATTVAAGAAYASTHLSPAAGAVSAADLAHASTHLSPVTTGPGAARPSLSPGELAPGSRLQDFLVVRRLGEGGMSTVYLAEDTRLQRQVAIKLLKAVTLEADRDALLREAQATARLNHPNIVTVYQVGVHEGQLFLALEYLSGPTLRGRLAEGPVRVGEALRLTHGIALALMEAHGSGVLHRDLKPENVLLPLDGRPRLLDFGLAALHAPGAVGELAAGASLESHHVGLRGTPAYMAPEQWRGEAASEAADVWALGVVLYELLTGERPFQGKDLLSLRARVQGGQPAPRLDHAREPLPRGLAALCAACLAKDPAHRPGAGWVAAQLRELAVRSQEEAGQWTLRARTRYALLLLGSLIFVFGGSGLAMVAIDDVVKGAPLTGNFVFGLIFGLLPAAAGVLGLIRGLSRSRSTTFLLLWGVPFAVVGLIMTPVSVLALTTSRGDGDRAEWTLIFVYGLVLLAVGVLFIIKGGVNLRRRPRRVA